MKKAGKGHSRQRQGSSKAQGRGKGHLAPGTAGTPVRHLRGGWDERRPEKGGHEPCHAGPCKSRGGDSH